MHFNSCHAGCGKHLPQQHACRLPACATGGERRSSSGGQNQHQRGRISSRSGSRPTGQAGFLSKVPEQQPAKQHESNASRTQQQLPQPAGIPAAVPAPPGADLYVPEPWEVNEPWDVDEPWEVPPGPNTSFQQEQRQQREQNAPPPLDAAVGLQDPPGWLNQQDDAEGSFDEYGSSDDDDDDDDGWLLEESEGLGESGISSGRSIRQQQQQQQQGVQDSWQDPSNVSLTPLLSPKHPQQQRQQPMLQQAPLPQQQLKQQQQVQPQGALPATPVDLQASWDAALAVSLEVLTSYDVRYDAMRPARVVSSSSAVTGRPPGGTGSGRASGLGVQEEVSLTAAAAAAARMARRRGKRQALSKVATPPLLQDAQQDQHSTTHTAAGDTAAAGLQEQPQTLPSQLQQQQQQEQEQEPLPEDARWLSVSRAHAAYLSYMQQLAAMVVSKQQQVHQLVYQIGISDSWLQLSHMLAVFGAREQLAPPVVAAMWKRLAAIINRKVFVRMSHAERCHYDAFIERLLQHSTRTLQQHTTTTNSSSSSASPARTGASKSSSGSSSMAVLTSPVFPGHLAAIAYGMAVLGTRSESLTAAVIAASAGLLSAAAAGSTEATSSSSTGSTPGPPAAASQGGSGGSGLVDGSAAGGGGGVAVWGPGEVSSLLWGLGTVGATPPADWLQDVLTVSRELLPRCQPSQLWGLLWGASQCGALPGDSWLASWLAAAQQQLDGFNAEGLAHSIWALAALGHVPHKLWLRAYCGMVAYKIKSFVSGQLSMVLPALSTLGYKPRPELRRTFMAQVRRNLHTYSPSQLVSVLSALAAYPPEEGAPASTSGWHPGRLLLYDAITQTSQPGVMGAWSGRQAAQVLWAFSRFRYVPDRAYLRALLLHLQAQLPLCDPDALSMAVWALAALRQTLPSEEWGRDWCRAAQDVGGEFGPQALAHGLSGMAALRMNPPAELMQVLTLTASSCLPSFSCMELGLLIAALADLHWRPSDAWMTAFVSQVSQQLPAFQNEDYGLLLYGLASLAQPLAPALLGRFCREAQRKLTGLSGEGLGLLMWGLAQYDYDMQGAGQWWADVFSECSCKWSSTGLRGCGLMALALAQLGPRHPPPGEWESGWVRRYKAVVTTKPRTWEELVVGFRAAAGLEPAEALPQSPWLYGLLLQLGAAWGLQELEGGAAAVAAVMQRVDARVAAAAMVVDTSGSGAGRAVLAGSAGAAVGPLQLALNGSGAGDDPEEGYGDVEPTSATAVLL